MVDLNANDSSSVTAGVDYDQIQVTGTPGTATLNGNLTINQNGGQFVHGTVYHVITTSSPTLLGTNGTVIGNFSSFTGLTISPFISFTPSINNDIAGHTGSYDLTVVRSNYNSVAANPNQAAVAGLTPASGLQGLVGVPGANSAIARIDNMSASDARAFFDQISPEPYAAYATALEDQGNLFTRQIEHRLAAPERSDDGTMSAWGNLYGQWGNGSRAGYRRGSDHDMFGGAIGVDRQLGADLTLGVAGGYSEDKVKYGVGNANGRSKSWQIGGYAGYHPGKLRADFQIAYVDGTIHARKRVNVGSSFSAISGVATASTSGSLFKAIGTVGYRIGDETLSFAPFVGYAYSSGHIDSFNEHGTMGALALHVGKIGVGRNDLLAGFKFAANMGSLVPYADAMMRYGLRRNHSDVPAYFVGLPSDRFTVNPNHSDKRQYELDAGLRYAIGKRSSIFFGYIGTLRGDLNEHGVNGGVRIAL